MDIEKDVKLGKIQKTLMKKGTNNQGNIKLHKLELMKFDGNIFKWQKNCNSHEATIHNSNSQSNIDKFNYLRAQLRRDARGGISRLKTTDASYRVAMEMLQKRYGKKQLIINTHYGKLKEMQASSAYYEKL